MTLREDLVAAKALIDTPEKWCKGSDWRGANIYTSTASYAPPAAIRLQMCARSAAQTIDCKRHSGVHVALIAALPDGWRSVAEFNDERRTTHADIMALFQRAIDACEN